ncbi:MAG: hypothetical protein SFW62_03185 [Alphaproteobacteria bacterium]|nr:hypothetical protein [Alphaproteobacteria bacterium]
MHAFKKHVRSAVLLCALLGVATSVDAAEPAKGISPDPNTSPVLARYIKMGASVYYMGSRSGLDGWFITQDKKIQVLYTTPDQKSFVVGALFDQEGQNVTVEQTKTLMSGNKELLALLMDPGTKAGDMPGAKPGEATTKDLSPGEQLMQELQSKASGVNIGNAQAPLLFMVVDPNCSHCQATWRALRSSVVDARVVQLRLIPIGRDADGEKRAAQMIQVPDVVAAWDKYIAGDKTQLAGNADSKFLEAVRANRALTERWSITQTPYLAYRGKDGKVKILQGEPANIQAVLSDLNP